MSRSASAESECVFVSEFSDVAPVPHGVSTGRSEAERPQVVADLHDDAEQFREFTVLLTDGRSIAIRGHALKHEAHSVVGQDVFSVVVRYGKQETVIALFKSMDVAGIFDGELRPDRKIA